MSPSPWCHWEVVASLGGRSSKSKSEHWEDAPEDDLGTPPSPLPDWQWVNNTSLPQTPYHGVLTHHRSKRNGVGQQQTKTMTRTNLSSPNSCLSRLFCHSSGSWLTTETSLLACGQTFAELDSLFITLALLPILVALLCALGNWSTWNAPKDLFTVWLLAGLGEWEVRQRKREEPRQPIIS